MKRIASVMCLCIATPLLAQRAIVETAAAYRNAPRLALVESSRWCSNTDASGCDFCNITEAIATQDGGLIASGFRGPIREFDKRPHRRAVRPTPAGMSSPVRAIAWATRNSR